MKFYAYVETSEGKAPLGSEGQYLFELFTKKGAIKHANNWAKRNPALTPPNYNGVVRLFTYSSFYDQKTFTQIL